MTRVLLVHQPIDGGVGRHVGDLANGLDRCGFEVVLCGPAIPAGVRPDVAHVRLDLGRAITPHTDMHAVGALGKIVRELRPSVIHAHSSKAGAIARLMRLAQPGTPVVYSPHGYAFKGHFERKRERWVYREVERVLAPLASRVLCVCEAEAQAARTIGPRGRVRVVYNGIAPIEAVPVESRIAALSKAGPVVGALTMLRPGKGIETLIDAIPQVRRRHPDVQVAIVGDGPDLETLRQRATLRGVAGVVRFLGPTKQPLSALGGMEVFVHPSWAESFPYVILEAMSLGRAIVASDVGGISEAIVDGTSGVLVPARDDSALSRTLTQLLDNAELRRRLGRAARLRQREQFTTANMIAGVASIYRETAGRRHSGKRGVCLA